LLARVRSLLRVKELYDELAQSRDALAEQAHHLAMEKSRAEAILYSMGDGVFTTELDGRITLLNPAAEQIAGVTLEAALGQPWHVALGVRGRAGQSLEDGCPICES